MKKWEIINEYNVEMDAKTKSSAIIDKLFENGIGNCTKDTVATVETLEEARDVLGNYKCTSRIASAFASKVRIGDFYYAAEVEYNEDYEEWEQTGNFEFAEIAEDNE